MIADPVSHRPCKLQHGLPRFVHQFITGLRLLLIEMEHLVVKDIVGENRLDLPDAVPGEICLSGFLRPRHHMYMRMRSFIVERSIPTKIIRRNLHRFRDIVAVRFEKIPPCGGVVEAESGSILTLEGDDVRPHISVVAFQLTHRCIEIHGFLITEQTVGADSFRSGTSCYVLHVLLGLLNRIPVGLQGQRDKSRCVDLGRLRDVVLVLVE